VVALWRAGEKVLVFYHYRATGRALRQHISALLNEEIDRLGQATKPNLSLDEAHKPLEDFGERFFKDEDLRVLVSSWIDGIVVRFPALLSGPEAKSSMLYAVTFVPHRLSFAIYRCNFGDDLSAPPSQTRSTQLTRRNSHYARRLNTLVDFLRSVASTLSATFSSRRSKLSNGTHFGKEVRALFDPAENRGISGAAGAALLPNVQMANGEVHQETRQRLLLTFNTQLFPEVLIASSVRDASIG
jgi:hypothetical protein